MTNALGRHMNYHFDIQLHPPTENDTPLSEVAETYRQLVGDLHYIVDNTRLDLDYVTGKVGTAKNQPTTRNLHAIKSTISYLIRTQNTGIVLREGQPKCQILLS